MKIQFLALLVLFVAAFAHAEGNYVCKDAQNTIEETVSVTGKGNAAKIHISDVTMEADLTVAPEGAGQMPGYDFIVGTVSNKLTDPPSQFQGGFLIQTELLNDGETGSLKRFTGEGFLTSLCTKTAAVR